MVRIRILIQILSKYYEILVGKKREPLNKKSGINNLASFEILLDTKAHSFKNLVYEIIK